ncbi:MAG: hypothetical protein HQK65_00985 [Desulfamplus sp.]|nr:hypothetical protein [Desulfamplus sp.]
MSYNTIKVLGGHHTGKTLLLACLSLAVEQEGFYHLYSSIEVEKYIQDMACNHLSCNLLSINNDLHKEITSPSFCFQKGKNGQKYKIEGIPLNIGFNFEQMQNELTNSQIIIVVNPFCYNASLASWGLFALTASFQEALDINFIEAYKTSVKLLFGYNKEESDEIIKRKIPYWGYIFPETDLIYNHNNEVPPFSDINAEWWNEKVPDVLAKDNLFYFKGMDGKIYEDNETIKKNLYLSAMTLSLVRSDYQRKIIRTFVHLIKSDVVIILSHIDIVRTVVSTLWSKDKQTYVFDHITNYMKQSIGKKLFDNKSEHIQNVIFGEYLNLELIDPHKTETYKISNRNKENLFKEAVSPDFQYFNISPKIDDAKTLLNKILGQSIISKDQIEPTPKPIKGTPKPVEITPPKPKPIDKFIEERCETDDNCSCIEGDLFREYLTWAQANSLPSTLSSPKFYEEIGKRGYSQNSSNGSFKGISLKS